MNQNSPNNIGSYLRCHCDESKIASYNAEKIIFKCWNCGLEYGQMKSYRYNYFGVQSRNQKSKQINKKVIFGIAFAIVLICSAVLVITLGGIISNFYNSNSNPSSTPSIVNHSSTPFNLTTQAPTFSPTPTLAPTDSAPSTVSTSQDQQDLVNYALSLINSDRQANGLQNVTLSSINSGQIHADDTLKNSYFSHWDLNSYKPYMRYTLAGGRGSVSENIAYVGQTGNIFALDVKSELKDREYSMMYEDAAENWGHRDNILDPLHNKVSIGIAYDKNNVYFVQDFENDYISWNQLNISNNQVTMAGTIESQQTNIQQISVYYDSPVASSVSQLGQAPYNDGYDPGTSVGLVLTGNWQAQNGITIKADNWQQNGINFQIIFHYLKR